MLKQPTFLSRFRDDEGQDLFHKRGNEFKLPYPLLDLDMCTGFDFPTDDIASKMKGSRNKKQKPQVRIKPLWLRNVIYCMPVLANVLVLVIVTIKIIIIIIIIILIIIIIIIRRKKKVVCFH